MFEILSAKYDNLSPQSVDEFLSELRNASKEDEYGTVAFLRDRIDSFVDEIQEMYSGEISDESKSILKVHAQVVSAYLLLLGKTSGYEFQQKYLLLLEILSHLSRRSCNMLAEKAVKCLTGGISSVGFTWLDITSMLSADILAYKITEAPSVADPDVKVTVPKKGTFTITNGEIKVSAYPEAQMGTLTKTFSICSDCLNLYVKDSREERLKESEQQNITSIDNFINGFCANQKACKQTKKEALKTYREEDSLPVRITGLDDKGNIMVESIDPQYKKIHGLITEEELVVGLKVSQLVPYLTDGCCISDAILEDKDGDRGYFTIYNSYVNYAEKQANYARRYSTVFPAKAINIYGTDRINWISYNGIGMISFYDPSVKVGDVRAMSVLNVKDNNGGFYINAKIVGPENVLPGKGFNPDDVLKYYLKEYEYLKKNFVQPIIFAQATELKDSAVRSLATILLNSLHDRNSLEYYRRLCVSRVLYTLIGDNDKAEFAQGKASYIRNCILFARGESITFPERDIVYNSETQTKVLSTLLCLGHHEREGALCSLLSLVPQESALAKIARLILSKNTALLADNDMGYSDAALRREVATILDVSDMVLDEDCADIPTGKYGNVERYFREFKSSYVYRNDDSGADFQKQGREEIFQAVCGLLNSEGGQVYLGVNNNGDPIVDSSWGLSADIKWLKSNYIKINSLRKAALGHNVPKVTDIDSYVNFLCEEKKIYFKESVLDNIIIEPTEDADAICITVTPSKYEIAYLYEDYSHSVGQPFRRDGNRTIPMTETEKQKRLMKLQSIGKEVEFQIKIQEAIDQQKKIILKNYASSEIRDRFLAPINLLYGGESVWCVDLEDPHKTCKQFRLSRAEAVEVVDEKYPHGKPAVESDIFRFTGECNIHVKLSMNIKAKNYLIEEYPLSRHLSDTEFYKTGEGSEARWILDTYISNVVGVRRFYIGLADKIDILPTEDSDSILDDIKSFTQKHISSK